MGWRQQRNRRAGFPVLGVFILMLVLISVARTCTQVTSRQAPCIPEMRTYPPAPPPVFHPPSRW